MLIAFLMIAPPVIAILYAIAEQVGWMDRVTGRRSALEDLKRMRSATGYLKAWIFNNASDAGEFAALEGSTGKAERVCNVGELEKWLSEDREDR